MEKHKLLIELILLPKTFKASGVSIASLLKDLKYLDYKHEVSEEDIANILVTHKDYIDLWEQWSQDKRTNKGWSLLLSNKKSVVSYYPENDCFVKMSFTNKVDACAAFIKRELDSIVES